MKRLALIALLTALTPCVNAQKTVSAAPHFSRLRSPSPSFNLGSPHDFAAFPGHRSFFSPAFFSDPLYSDALYSQGYPVASQPPIILMQAPPPSGSIPEPPPSPAQPLMIELQGDRYVRVSGEDASGAEMIDQKSTLSHPARAPSEAAAQIAPQDLPPVILIFRDGHREEVSDYIITDAILYARANYYADGSWNKKIELSSLNLPETVNSNRSRGVRFQLPTAPNEVITRP